MSDEGLFGLSSISPRRASPTGLFPIRGGFSEASSARPRAERVNNITTAANLVEGLDSAAVARLLAGKLVPAALAREVPSLQSLVSPASSIVSAEPTNREGFRAFVRLERRPLGPHYSTLRAEPDAPDRFDLGFVQHDLLPSSAPFLGTAERFRRGFATTESAAHLAETWSHSHHSSDADIR